MFRKLPRTFSNFPVYKVAVLFFLVLVTLLAISFNPRISKADPVTDLLQKIDQLKNDIANTQAQQSTLANEIKYIDEQISLTGLEIQAKEAEIENLTGDIGNLSVRLDRISSFMEFQNQVFISKARSAYISSQLSPLDIVLGADNLDSAFRKIKYLKATESQDSAVLEEMKKTRDSFNAQKETLEQKKVSVEDLKKELESQSVLLSQQEASKQNLLAVTQNNEATYQKLLRQAESELEAIREAVSLRGGATPVYNQTSCDSWGCYYNQRDAKWFYTPIGYSRLATGEYGCLITSVAMVATHYGRNIDPGDISMTPSAFFSSTAFLNFTINVAGTTIDRSEHYSGYAQSVIDAELAAGRPVIVGVMMGGFADGHFVVLKGKNSSGYILNDPWYEGAHDIPFSRYYSTSQITSTYVVRVY